jgi:hypothetical protein
MPDQDFKPAPGEGAAVEVAQVDVVVVLHVCLYRVAVLAEQGIEAY